MTTNSMTGTVAPRRRTFASRLAAWTAPATRPFAGRRIFPLWSLLEHEGRRSGRRYRTPVAARRVADGFVIPIAFGEGADWTRNVLASGRCTLVWKGRRYPTDRAEVIDAESARPAFSRIQRAIMGPIGLDRFIRVHDAVDAAGSRS